MQKKLLFQIYIFHRGKWSRHPPSCPKTPTLTGLGIAYSQFSDFCLKTLQFDWQKCWTPKAAIVVQGKRAFTFISFCLIFLVCREGLNHFWLWRVVVRGYCSAPARQLTADREARGKAGEGTRDSSMRGRRSVGCRCQDGGGDKVTQLLPKQAPSIPPRGWGWAHVARAAWQWAAVDHRNIWPLNGMNRSRVGGSDQDIP